MGNFLFRFRFSYFSISVIVNGIKFFAINFNHTAVKNVCDCCSHKTRMILLLDRRVQQLFTDNW